MVSQRKKYHLENILELRHYMRIAIDEAVETDDDGHFLINVGYLRVSTDRQADLGYGLEIQEDSVVRYCRSAGFTNLVLFIDDGFTGTKMERPALKGITDFIEDYNSGKSNIRIQSFIVPRIDRLGRTLLGTLQFIQDYIVAQKDSKNTTINRNKESIHFASVAENYCRVDANNPQGVFLLGLFSTLAEYDRDLIVQKLKAGRKARVASGKWMGGGNIPYGYEYNKELGKLIVIPEQADMVREIFRLYIDEKLAPQKIANRLGFKGDRIITQILKRKSLTGCITYNGEEFPGEHEAIISLERWEEAQEELENRSVHRADSNYLLSGLLVCGECGAKMRYQKWGKSGTKIVCYSRQSSKPSLVKDENCESELFWSDDIENAVIQQLFQMSYLGNADSKKDDVYIDPIVSLSKQLKEINRKLSKLYELDDDEADDVLKEKVDTLRKQKRQIEQQIQSVDEKEKIAKKVKKAKEIFRTLEGAWQHMSDKEKQAVCRELIDRVVVYKNATLDVHLKLRSYLVKT